MRRCRDQQLRTGTTQWQNKNKPNQTFGFRQTVICGARLKIVTIMYQVKNC